MLLLLKSISVRCLKVESPFGTAVRWFPSRYSSVTSLGIPLGNIRSPLLLQRTTESTQVHWEGQGGESKQLLSSLPSQVKSWTSTSWIGISFKKKGFKQRGFPLTILFFLNHFPSQAKWQLQLKELASKLIVDKETNVLKAPGVIVLM